MHSLCLLATASVLASTTNSIATINLGGGSVPLRTMILGSGLAWGQSTPQTGGGFLALLSTLLSADGHAVTFVGTFTGSGSSCSESGLTDEELHHDAVQAAPNASLSDALRWANYTAVAKPNLVVVAVGLEDVLYGDAMGDLEGFRGVLKQVVMKTWKQTRSSTVLLNLPPVRDQNADKFVRQANEVIAGLVTEQQGLSRKLIMGDIYSNLSTSDFSQDGVWPTEKGYTTVAAVIVATLRDAASRGWLEKAVEVDDDVLEKAKWATETAPVRTWSVTATATATATAAATATATATATGTTGITKTTNVTSVRL